MTHGKEQRKKTKQARGDRSKRLLDLVMLLLRTRTPVPYREIREQFPSYQTANVEAGLRAFERDKAELLELGVPIRYVTADEDDSVQDGGYVIELKSYVLPAVKLTPDEISSLVLAASVARAMPGAGYARICDLAVRKLAFDYPDPQTPLSWPPGRGEGKPHDPVLVHFPETASSTDRALSERFEQLEAATRNRKCVSFSYKKASTGAPESRAIDPYGLFYRDRSWFVAGRCHLRNDTRSFRLDRMSDVKVASRPKSPDFERPNDFDVRSYATRSPWLFTPRQPEEVVLQFGKEAQSVANEDFGPEAEHTSPEPNVHRVRFVSGNPDYIVSRILAAKGSITLVSGEQCKTHLAVELEAIEELYS